MFSNLCRDVFGDLRRSSQRAAQVKETTCATRLCELRRSLKIFNGIFKKIPLQISFYKPEIVCVLV